MNSLARFWRWPLSEKKLFFSACCWTCYYFFIIYLQPASKLKKHLGQANSLPLQIQMPAASQITAQQIRLTIHRAKRCLPSKNQCLVYALACKKILKNKKIPHTLFLGMRKLEGKLVAHAWLISGELDVVGGEEKQHYQIIGAFSS